MKAPATGVARSENTLPGISCKANAWVKMPHLPSEWAVLDP